MCLSLGKRRTGRRNVHVVNRKRNGPAISAQHLYPLMENCSTRFRWRFWQIEKYNSIILRQIEKFFIPLPVVVSLSYQEKVLYEGRWPTFFRRQQEQLLQHPLLSPLFKLSIIFWIQRRQLYNLHCCPNCLSCPETFPVSVTELDRQRRTPFIVGWVVTLHPNRSYRRATLHLDLNQRFVRKAIRRKGCTTDFWYFRTAKKQRRIGTPGCPVATGRRGRLWAECP